MEGGAWKPRLRNGLATWSGWVIAGRQNPDTTKLCVYDAETGEAFQDVLRCNLDTSVLVVADMDRVQEGTEEIPSKRIRRPFILRHEDGREWRSTVPTEEVDNA